MGIINLVYDIYTTTNIDKKPSEGIHNKINFEKDVNNIFFIINSIPHDKSFLSIMRRLDIIIFLNVNPINLSFEINALPSY